MYRIALVLLLAATSSVMHGAGDPAAEALEGTWLVNVSDQPRERFLIVSGARSDRNRVHVATAMYGWIDAKGKEVDDWNAQVAGDTIRLSFVTPGNSLVKVEFKADDPTVSGTLVTKAGNSYELRMTRLPAQEVAALRAAAAASKKLAHKKALADRTGKLRLLYVGAGDCGACRYYERTYIRGGRMKELFPAFYEIEYVPIDIGSYRNKTWLKESNLPDDLKWLVDKKAPALRQYGTPFFAALTGESILAQGHGENALWNLVAPALTKAVEARRSSN
jgi:hypothetical protein